jgi:hypothetical protein
MNSYFSHVNFLWLEAVMLSYSPSRWFLMAADIWRSARSHRTSILGDKIWVGHTMRTRSRQKLTLELHKEVA